MKKLLLLVLCIIVTSGLYAQSSTDVVYLKNGSVIYGSIQEVSKEGVVSIKLEDGKLFTIPMDMVRKIQNNETKQEVAKIKKSAIAIRAGYLYSTMSLTVKVGGQVASTNEGMYGRSGFLVGAFYDYRMADDDRFGFDLGVLYKNTGYKAKTDGLSETDVLHYLELTNTYYYYFGRARKFRFGFGFDVGYLINAQSKLNTGGQSVKVKVSDYFRNVNLGGNFVIGYSGLDLSFGGNYTDILSSKYDDLMSKQIGQRAKFKGSIVNFIVSYTYRF